VWYEQDDDRLDREGGQVTKHGIVKNMAYGNVDSFIIVVHTKETPTDAEWDAYLEFCMGVGMTFVRCLVVTRGGAPTSAQRRRMHEVVADARRSNPQALRGAIVTPSTFVRGVVNAMSLIEPVYKAFAPAEIGRAYEYIGVPQRCVREIDQLVASLEAELGLTREP
jgi:hypothetical protein